MASPLLDWLREHTASWTPSIVGVFRENAVHDWPFSATSAPDLRQQLTETGHLLPLPTESAALANVMEIELRQHLIEAAALTPDAEVAPGTQRSYPDLEFSGPAFGGGCRAVDIKCARRGKTGVSLGNRIALYTGNTYFLWPQLKFSGILRPFGDYNELISIVVIHTFDPTIPERITDVQVIAHESWRIASKAIVWHAGVHRLGPEDRRPCRRPGFVRVSRRFLRVLAPLGAEVEEVPGGREAAPAGPRCAGGQPCGWR